MALLTCRLRGERPPWIRLVLDDLAMLHRCVPQCAGMPDPRVQPDAWLRLARDFPAEWAGLIGRIVNPTSSVGPQAQRQTSAAAGGRQQPPVASAAYSCSDCNGEGVQRRFRTAKALAQHARIAHGASCVVLQFLPADGSCPHCERSYASRLRAAAHVNDRRRGAACKAALLPGRYPRLSDEALAALRLEEAAARKEARATGHSQPLVAGSNR